MYLFGGCSSILEARRASDRAESDAWGPVPRVWVAF